MSLVTRKCGSWSIPHGIKQGTFSPAKKLGPKERRSRLYAGIEYATNVRTIVEPEDGLRGGRRQPVWRPLGPEDTDGVCTCNLSLSS